MAAPTAQTERRKAADNWTLRGENFAAATFLIPGFGFFPNFQLFNPVGNTLVGLIDRGFMGRPGAGIFMYCQRSTAAVGAVISTGFSKLDGTPGTMEFRTFANPAFALVTLYDGRSKGANDTVEFDFDDGPVIIKPGEGLLLHIGNSANAVSVGGFHWRERDPIRLARP